MNIVLCGMMGSGKTTVAAVLSDKYGLPKVDTDEEIVKRHGAIDKIFLELGEEKFRDIEEGVTREISESFDNAVISLGGGCVLRESNVTNLKKTGKIFYLKASAETIIKRLKGDTTRPLLKGDLEERVNTILRVRSSIYGGVSDFVIETDGLTPEEIANKIMEKLQ
ncbi:MAG: shikimate kinase [Clostridia bacterium]|nr:shikimate kinase [Clostridia bacterium]